MFDSSAGFNAHPPHKPISAVLAETVEAKGVQAAIAQYQELRTLHGDEYDFEQHDLNLLGYTLLSKGKTLMVKILVVPAAHEMNLTPNTA